MKINVVKTWIDIYLKVFSFSENEGINPVYTITTILMLLQIPE